MKRGKRGPQQRRSRGPCIFDDALWARIEPLIPKRERKPGTPGRKPLDDRKALCGILFVLYTGIQWQWLPQELGFECGMTCWRRLRDWQEAGVWEAPPSGAAR
ncbi:transposase [Glycomyces sp. TRM65418]|nr:transposase [Glycomyces sp. TRM65418]MCC3762655.1 transposase [Glycomyces sp. TRM65418]QZD56690.1 transposase [Glycomyces sp. TRM65418]